MKLNREERDKSNQQREEEEKSELAGGVGGCRAWQGQRVPTERPSKGHPGNPSRDILVAVELVAAPAWCLWLPHGDSELLSLAEEAAQE